MANTKKMDCVILGLLNHEELTGYEIKFRMDTSLKLFWGASYGSIYPTLAVLEKQGFVTSENVSTNGREKIAYKITEAGRDYLKEWLGQPVEKDEIRYETLLKLFFGTENGPIGTLKHITSFEEKISSQLMMLRGYAAELEKVMEEEEQHMYYLLTVKFGIQMYEGYLNWCREVKEQLSKQAEKNKE